MDNQVNEQLKEEMRQKNQKENVIGLDSINRAFVECNDQFYTITFKNSEVDYFNRNIVFEIISSITNKKQNNLLFLCIIIN